MGYYSMMSIMLDYLQLILMFAMVRKVVAGPKNTTSYEGEELDLTYITDRVIAMAFPASDFIEKTYRNSIQDVASYLQETHHNNYLVINVSSRNYNYTLFKQRVKDYEWPDHQTPPFTTLVQVAFDMYSFLKDSKSSVVAVHCNHGKGRTGTAIISLMILIGFFREARECLQFYNSKRFSKTTYGVDQPCQLRYLQFLEHAVRAPKIHQKLICYRLKGITNRGLSQDYYLNITSTRSQQLIHQKMKFDKHVKEGNKLLLADIFIELFWFNWASSKRVARVNFNLYFLNGETKLKFKGEDIKLSGGQAKQFQITLHLQYYCLCHLPTYQESNCRCRLERMIEENHWNRMMAQVNECNKLNKQDAIRMLYVQKNSSPDQRGHRKQGIVLNKSRYEDKKEFKTSRQEKLHARFLTSQQKKQMAADDEKREEEQEGSPEVSPFEKKLSLNQNECESSVPNKLEAVSSKQEAE